MHKINIMCVDAYMNVSVSRSLGFISAQTLLQNPFEASCESTVETRECMIGVLVLLENNIYQQILTVLLRVLLWHILVWNQ